MSYNAVLRKIVRYLALESGRDEEILLFGLRLALTTIFGYVLLTLVAAWLGLLLYVLAAAVTASVLRVFSGGAHASSQLRCSLGGVIIFIPLAFLAKVSLPSVNPLLMYIIISVAIYGLVITYLYAPADTPAKPISSKMQRKNLRMISLVIVGVWCLVAIILVLLNDSLFNRKIIFSSSLGIWWQTTSLTPVGYGIVNGVDVVLKKLMKGGESE